MIWLLVFIFSVLDSDVKLIDQDSDRILIQNHYWAKEGKIQEVYEHRLYASSVRKKLGFAEGRVLLRKSNNSSLAHVIWECEFESEEARQKDIRLLTETGEFEEIMDKMGTLIDKFERATYSLK